MELYPKRIVVDEKPFMVLMDEQIFSNLDFIKSLSPSYFHYLAENHFAVFSDDTKSDERQNAALSIRLTYSHAIETLFALLFSAFQAPDCIAGWLKKYQTNDIKNLILKINNRHRILTKFTMKEFSWNEIVRIIYKNVIIKDVDTSEKYKEKFATILSRFANDFLEDKIREEYNSIKHGFRVNLGGFGLSVGIQEAPDIPAPEEKMQSMGYYNYGSTFPVEVKIRNNEPSFRLKYHSRNWDIENFVHSINLISVYLNNIQSFLKIVNGMKPSECKVEYPTDLEYFSEPWKRIIEINDASFDIIIDEKQIPVYTENDILEYYMKINT